LDSIIAGVLVIDQQTGGIVAANSTAARLAGLELDQVIGMSYADLISDTPALETIPSSQMYYQGLLCGNKPIMAGRRWLHEGGRGYVVESFVDVSPLKDVQDRQAEVVRKLEMANKELTDFAHVVSHDLKAPLRGIKSLATWIAEDCAPKLDDQDKANIKLLLDRVTRMEELIDGILQYSRAGRPSEQEGPVDLSESVPAVVELLSPPSHITISIAQPLPKLRADKTRINQVFQNLISNAIKFMDKPKGLIRIGCTDDGEFWRFYVSDNGPGIEKVHFDKIFQLFQTLHSKDQFNSTGVGLAVVKKIVNFYGGNIWVESEVGKGTTFYFTLPKIK
jgi:light-regulated signal transduction histidine kinase (bacteriophytochrome)